MAFVERNVGADDFPVDHKGYLIEDPAKHVSELLDAVLDEHAHELAEKIRTELAERVTQRIAGLGTISTHYSAEHAADLIDPEVPDGRP